MLKKTNKSYTFEEAKKRLENYCVYQERCHLEVETKLASLGLISEAKELIIIHLIEHDFLNEERFSKAFSRGKFRIKKWGKQRILRELKARNISEYNRKIALKEIDEGDYIKTFNDLALKKYQSITKGSVFQKRKKLADYLFYRGWESDLIYNKIKELIK